MSDDDRTQIEDLRRRAERAESALLRVYDIVWAYGCDGCDGCTACRVDDAVGGYVQFVRQAREDLR